MNLYFLKMRMISKNSNQTIERIGIFKDGDHANRLLAKWNKSSNDWTYAPLDFIGYGSRHSYTHLCLHDFTGE